MTDRSFMRAVMEGEDMETCPKPYFEQRKLTDILEHSPYSQGRIRHRSQSPSAWQGKVDMSEDPNMDVCEYYDTVEVSIARDKRSSENLHLKRGKKLEVPMQGTNLDEQFEIDIDKKLAGKKVVIPVETKDERILPPEHILGVQPKKRSQKRGVVDTSCQQTANYTLNPVKLKETTDLVQKIRTGTATGEKVCITYNPNKFSDIHNLEPLPHFKATGGSFGVVFKVKDTLTRQILIQKKISLVKKNAKGEFDLDKNEYEVPIQFPDAVNIAKFYGLAWNGIELIFVMEDAGLSLRELIISQEYRAMLNEPDKKEKIMSDMYTAVSHLAKHGITHCDIKPENVCLNVSAWVSKLVDFGSSKTLQDAMTYKGVTPEYLDPSANRFLFELHALRNKNYPVHKLEEKDDVYSTGLVGLFLIKGAHPMILFFTGSSEYPNNPTETQNKRMLMMKQISEINQDTLLELLNTPMSDVMRELLLGVLALDRQQRWTSKVAALFLQGKLIPDLQPPNKLSRQEQQQWGHTQPEDLSKFVDLGDKVVAQIGRKQKPCYEAPGSPEICQGQDTEQRLGIAFKGPALSAKAGMILVPAKFRGPMYQGQMEAVATTTQALDAKSSQQETAHQPYISQKLSDILPKDQETKEYDDLVESFNVKLIPSTCKLLLPAQMNQPQHHSENSMAQSSVISPQRMLLQNPGTGQGYICPRFAQTSHPGTAPIQGLFGHMYNVTGQGGVCAGPTFTPGGNIPQFDAIMQSHDEYTRPKAKGVRRSRTSQN